MRLLFRLASAPALVALAGVAAVGCGGNSGSQPTTSSQVLVLRTSDAYPSTTAAVDTLSDGRSVAPIAEFESSSGQELVAWGSRDASGNVASVYETAFADGSLRAPVYARYDAVGNLLSVKDSDTGSYVTFSDLDTSDGSNQGSVTGVGYDASDGKTESVKATLTSDGVTVSSLSSATAASAQTRFVSNAEIAAVLAKPAAARDTSSGALAGFTTVYQGSDARTRILTAVFKAASLAVKKPFSTIVTDVAGFLLLNQLEASYTTYAGKGLATSVQTSGATPIAYVSGLPTPVGS